jgi:fructose-bisphosphate aldolase class I
VVVCAGHRTQALVTGRGILAADESVATMSARLLAAGADPAEDNRRAYRELLVTTPGLAGAVSGVILGDETLRQRVADGRTLPEAMTELGLLVGIKVDTGTRPLAGATGEALTEGLDGLRERLAEYVTLGARFAKALAHRVRCNAAARAARAARYTRALEHTHP